MVFQSAYTARVKTWIQWGKEKKHGNTFQQTTDSQPLRIQNLKIFDETLRILFYSFIEGLPNE